MPPVIKRLEDLEHVVSLSGRMFSTIPLKVTARVVSTDGAIEDRTHTVEVGFLKVTSKSVVLRFSPRKKKFDPNGFTREVALRRKMGTDKARLDLRRISDHLCFLLAPQNPGFFGMKEALMFSVSVLNLLQVSEVMET